MDEYVVWLEISEFQPIRKLTTYNTLEDAMYFVRTYPPGLWHLSITHYSNGEMLETIYDWEITH